MRNSSFWSLSVGSSQEDANESMKTSDITEAQKKTQKKTENERTEEVEAAESSSMRYSF